MAAAGLEALLPVLEKTGQQHLLEGYKSLPEEQQAALLEQLKVRAPGSCSVREQPSRGGWSCAICTDLLLSTNPLCNLC